jgi:threonylcarbamoyladenosine tRNA methylthiotransferase MtaB
MKFHIHTTGCKANQWDSGVISERLKKMGFVPVSQSEADLIIVNACAVTEGAERDTRRYVANCGRNNKAAQIILTGCHGQVYPEKGFGAHSVIGQAEKMEIEKYLDKRGVFVSDKRNLSMERVGLTGPLTGKTRYFFKIQDGCDRFCTYCVVPFGRGAPRSRPLTEVMDVLKGLKEKDVKEVVLTGIELSSYRDPASGLDLKGLLRLIEEQDTPPRIRLSSIDPLYVDEEFAEIIGRSDKIAKSLHIPLQSGSDPVLKKMGRPYDSAYIRKMVERVNTLIHGAGIGMDVIVGFPGENEEMFMTTYTFLESLDIYYLHVFPFSPRKGTVAATMEERVPTQVKKQRVSLLRRLDGSKRRQFYERFLGTEARVIPEGKVYKGAFLRGYTDNYLPVYLPYKKGLENSLIKVKIKEIEGEILVGEPAEG